MRIINVNSNFVNTNVPGNTKHSEFQSTCNNYRISTKVLYEWNFALTKLYNFLEISVQKFMHHIYNVH